MTRVLELVRTHIVLALSIALACGLVAGYGIAAHREASTREACQDLVRELVADAPSPGIYQGRLTSTEGCL